MASPLFTHLSSKKGFLFTILAIIIVSLFTVLFSLKPYAPEESEESIDARVFLLNAFTQELKETYLERVLRSTAKATLDAMAAYIRLTSSRFSDPHNSFSTIISSGSIPTYAGLTQQSKDIRFRLVTSQGTISVGFTSPSTFAPFGDERVILQEFKLAAPAYLYNLTLYFDTVSADDVFVIFYDNRSTPLWNTHFVPQPSQWNTLLFDDPVFIPAGVNFFILASPRAAADAQRIGVYTVAYNYACCDYYNGAFNYNKVTGTSLHLDQSSQGDVLVPLDLISPSLSMEGKNMQYFSRKISALATNKLKITTRVALSNISVAHTDPWTLNISAQASIFTQRLDTSFDLHAPISTLLSIEGLPNPLYAAYNLTSLINRTNITTWDFASMKQFFAKKHYRLNDDAPNFFMRYGQSFGGSSDGIETIADVPLSALGKQPGGHNYSRADWQFFFNPSGKCPTIDLYQFNDGAFRATEQFLFDIDHIASFGVNGTQYSFYCPVGGGP